MGYDAPVSPFDGRSGRDRSLEQHALLVRGPCGCRFRSRPSPRRRANGWLRVRFDGRVAELASGRGRRVGETDHQPAVAARQARHQAGMRVLALGAVDDGSSRSCAAGDRHAPSRPASDAGRPDLQRRSAGRSTASERWRRRSCRPARSGRCAPRATARDRGGHHGGGKRAGLVDVKVVSFSDTSRPRSSSFRWRRGWALATGSRGAEPA